MQKNQKGVGLFILKNGFQGESGSWRVIVLRFIGGVSRMDYGIPGRMALAYLLRLIALLGESVADTISSVML